MDLTHRLATEEDLALLGELNRQLIDDEGHSNPMSPAELAERMRGWLAEGLYRVVVFERQGEVVGFATFCGEGEEVYLRQLFVSRAHRSRGLGARMLEALEAEYFAEYGTVRLDVLSGNHRAHLFYERMGFADYCVTMKKPVVRSAARKGR